MSEDALMFGRQRPQSPSKAGWLKTAERGRAVRHGRRPLHSPVSC